MSYVGSNGKGNRSRGVQWKRFDGYESMPFQHTDHFIVMCRSVPVEYASFTPTCNLMDMAFPPSCKLPSQRYGCVSVNDFKKSNADGNSSSLTADMNDTLLPLYSREMACVADVHAVTHTKVECLRYAVLTVNSQIQPSHTTVLVVPLYSWLVISEDLISTFSCAEYMHDSISQLDDKIEQERNGGKKYMNSKTSTEELRVALQGFGVSSNLRQNSTGDSDESVLQGAAVRLLRRDAKMKMLMDEVNKRLTTATSVPKGSPGKEDPKDTRGGQGKRSKEPGSGDVRKLNSSDMEVQRRAAIAALIEARSRVIALNDELCNEEVELKGSAERNRPDCAASAKANLSLGSRSIGSRRVAVLEALQFIPNMKNVKIQSESTRKTVPSGLLRSASQSVVAKETASDRRQQRMLLPYLKNKLDLIDDIMFQQTD